MMEHRKFVQTPRERLLKQVDFTSFLQVDETIDEVSVTITPPTAVQEPGYVAPGYDQRIVEVDTSVWVFNSINTIFPLQVSPVLGVSALGDQYVTLVLDATPQRPSVDFVVQGSQLVLTVAPAPGVTAWCLVQNPVIPATDRRDQLTDPPYSAFSALGYIVAPANKKVMLASMGGAAPLTYRARLLAHTTNDQTKEVVVDYAIKEP